MHEKTKGNNWLQAFEDLNGRKLRVLHIGNIANNAYLVAKFQRCAGIEADVLSYDYYHVMGTPEWEELLITHDYGDDFRPHFSSEDIGTYQRPRWFVSGPLIPCVNYLMAVRSGDQERSSFLWTLLERARLGDLPNYSDSDNPNRDWNWRRFCSSLIMLPYRVARGTAKVVHRSLRARGFERASQSFYRWAQGRGVVRNTIKRLVTVSAKVERGSHLVRFNELKTEFKNFFPERSDQLGFSDFAAYLDRIEPLERLFSQYDIVQAYATDPILPLICDKRPFVAFEHGTLRDFIREDDPLHRLTALAYRKADHVFVTNGDCQEHAQWLGCENATAMLHPIDVDQHRERDEGAIATLRERYGADVILFCPIRHDWAVKGTDLHLRALPDIRRRISGRVVLVLAPWGLQIGDSRALIKTLDCETSVAWLARPLSRIELIRHLQAADVVLDQMTLPHFGATAPQALAAGTPVVMSYKPESTAWIVDEPAPILPAFSPDDVANAVVTAIDPTWRADFKDRARAWVDIHHHNNRVVHDHLTAYHRILETCHVSG
jgi:glycosyltransferase involved in cell wall biosynthesis